MGNDQYLTSLNKIADNLLAEFVNDEINWHTVKLIGQELVILSGEAISEQIKQRQEYIRSKYGGKE